MGYNALIALRSSAWWACTRWSSGCQALIAVKDATLTEEAGWLSNLPSALFADQLKLRRAGEYWI
jgi:hypothetical protein